MLILPYQAFTLIFACYLCLDPLACFWIYPFVYCFGFSLLPACLAVFLNLAWTLPAVLYCSYLVCL